MTAVSTDEREQEKGIEAVYPVMGISDPSPLASLL